VLELLRYKRAAKGLIRAEAERGNKYSNVFNLNDLDRLLLVQMPEDANLEKLICSE
jgi:hypothetical protein